MNHIAIRPIILISYKFFDPKYGTHPAVMIDGGDSFSMLYCFDGVGKGFMGKTFKKDESVSISDVLTKWAPNGRVNYTFSPLDDCTRLKKTAHNDSYSYVIPIGNQVNSN